MRLKQYLVFAFAIILSCALGAQEALEPVNPHATPEARALLAYLNSISGKATIAGQHNYPNDASRWTDLAYDLTGKYPGLFGEDFGFSAGDDKDSVLSRPAMIAEVKRQYRNGADIALTWHEVRPTDDEPVSFRNSVQGHLTDYEWHELLTPGSPLNKRWCTQVDVIAGYLRQLRDAHVPVLFRPYHEINGNWFWWTGRPGNEGSAALYRQIYERFVNLHHLDNLVWVWNVNAPGGNAGAIADYFPGTQYADVITMDIYGEFKQEYYTSMAALAGDKPIALAEVGGLPSPEVLDRQPRWTYFMAWSEWIQTGSSLDLANSVYHAPRVLTRDDPRLDAPMAAIRKAAPERTTDAPDAEPVTPGAIPEAKALLAQLNAAPGKAILSGQENTLASPTAATDAVVAATGRRPSIYAAELNTVLESVPSLAGARQAIVKEALAAHKRHAAVSLSWRAARPTDGSPADGHGQLTDFEWNELLTPGSTLNKLWCGQVDEIAETLRQLQSSGVAVLWNPLPESNGKEYWWAGRKGIHGSAELYRQLYDRLVNHDDVYNLLWFWEIDAPRSQGDEIGAASDYFPGLLYVDAVEARAPRLNPGVSRFLEAFSAGKPLGIELSSELPTAQVLTERAQWSWFLAAALADAPTRNQALQSLYADPRIASIPASQ